MGQEVPTHRYKPVLDNMKLFLKTVIVITVAHYYQCDPSVPSKLIDCGALSPCAKVNI